MRLIQYDDGSARRVGRVGDDRTVTPLRQPDGLSTDELVVAVAMGDVRAEPDGPPSSLDGLVLAPPVRRPGSVRDFMLYEEHVANGLRPYGREVPAAWYLRPAFYFSCPATLLGSGAVVAPPATTKLDYEMELAVVVGRRLHDPGHQEATDAIAGFALFNDFSLRDVQAEERPVGLGPSKSKDFASAFGPQLVTPDEIAGDPVRPDLAIAARVNGAVWSEARSGSMQFDLAEVLMHAAQDSVLLPGDVVATGTLPSGCILELMALGVAGAVRWLQPGDEVSLASNALGTLTTTIGTRSTGSDPAGRGPDREGRWISN
jgi:2-keto-4-pentenoate hydratase/2-oxohepta-3-ene-1,7-dioic acid hydratase in catechol pathway